MNIYDGFGYTGGQFRLIYQDTIGFLQGNSLCLWNLETNKKEYIQSSKNGFQYFTSNYKQRIIAVAEYGLNPPVYIYNYPNRELILTLKGISELEIVMMDISPDGKYLLAITGVPKYEITIWNLETGEKQSLFIQIFFERMQGLHSTLPLKFNFQTASFSSTHSNRFVLQYQKVLQVYEVVPFYEKDENEEVVKKVKLELKGQFGLQAKNQYLKWDYQSELDTGDGTEETNIYLIQDNVIIYLSGKDLSEITRFQFQQDVKHVVFTQKHLIVAYESGVIEWLFKYIYVNVDDQTRLPFKLDKQYLLIAEDNAEKNITHLLYNHQYTRLIIGLADASLIILSITAEPSQEAEDDGDPLKDRGEEDQQEGKVTIIDADATKLGPYQKGAITFIKEIKSVHVLITGCESGKIVFWDIIKRDVICSYPLLGNITSGDLSANDQLLAVGTDNGVVRILNIANIRKPVLLKLIKLYKGKPISNVLFSPTQDTIAVSSVNSPKIYFLSVKALNLIGYTELPITCNGIAWNQSHKQVIGQGGQAMLFAITSFLLLGVQAPSASQQYQSLKLDQDSCPVYGRKIDPDQILIQVNPIGGEILTAGKDKVFKKYKQPEEPLQKMDLKLKVANQGPMDEQDGHSSVPTCFAISNKFSMLCSGASDGSLMMRSSDRLGQDVKMFKGHSLKMGGVSAIEMSSRYKVIYSGGFDGGLFWWSGEKIKQQDSDAEKIMKNLFDLPDPVQDQQDANIQHYQLVLEEEYKLAQAPIKEQEKKAKNEMLRKIKQVLQKLIEQNDNSDDLEKLNRDDFVIDISARDEILENGQKQRQQLREKIKRENFRQEILHKLIKERTWDNMEVPLKGINGLNTNIVVSNFHIRIRPQDELRKLQLVKEFRRQELKEKQSRKEKKIAEVWQLEDHITDPKSYIVNSIPGPSTLILTDYEKKEEQAPMPGAKGGVGQKGGPVRGGAAGKLGAGKQQADQKKQDEDKEKEDKEKEDKEKDKDKSAKQDEKKEGEEFSDWDYLYGVLELFTNNRKRNQMVLLNNVIFSIKRTFNKEFEKMMQVRQTELDNINERNKRIAEILNELHRPVELFEAKKNILENPENVLTVKNSEIPYERYLTKEERERREQERKKEEDLLRERMKDDAGIRAIKDMMGGTLEEKKETPLDEKLDLEEWMSKPPEEMTEEERFKLKEFEVKKQRLEEEKEKIRKNLENELKKLKNEVLEICFRLDEKLLILFRRKLEYDYRIYEQELYVIRLALSIIMQNEANHKIKELKDLMDELTIKQKQQQQMKDDLDLLRKEVESQRQKTIDQMNAAFNVRSNYAFDAGKIKNVWIYAFEELKKDDKKRKELDKRLLQDPQNKDILIAVDPMLEYDKKELKNVKDAVFDNYLKDIQEKVQNLQLFDYNDVGARDFTLNTLQNRFSFKKEFEKLDQELTDLRNFCQFNDNELKQNEENLQTSNNDHQDITTMLEKSKSNIEILVRFKQGFVEISQDKPVPNLSEAVLIPKESIDQKNNEIKKQGDKKLALMDDIKKIKFDVAKSEYELKRRELIIKDLECKTREVQLLKVKKEMQVALTKKDTRLNEQELKNLQDQIDMLKQATEKRIMIYQKKEEKIYKDIEFIQKENEQLLMQGANLNVSVKQLQEISDMTFKKNTKQNQGQQGEEATDNQAFDKFKQISQNRKYFDLAKKQTEEIELLREELNKLKARTFANFSNVSR